MSSSEYPRKSVPFSQRPADHKFAHTMWCAIDAKIQRRNVKKCLRTENWTSKLSRCSSGAVFATNRWVDHSCDRLRMFYACKGHAEHFYDFLPWFEVVITQFFSQSDSLPLLSSFTLMTIPSVGPTHNPELHFDLRCLRLSCPECTILACIQH